MEGINRVRQRVWKRQAKGFMEEAFIDIDGTIAQTNGKCKGGMGIKGDLGLWAIDREFGHQGSAYMVNRPGNVSSHEGSVKWIDRRCNLWGRMRGGSACEIRTFR